MRLASKPAISWVQKFLFSLLILFLIWVSSLYMYDREKMQDALLEREYLLQGITPFQWSFSSRSELSAGHGIDEFDWTGELLKGDLVDPYFYLNLQGRYIDARRYKFIRLRIQSDTYSDLRIFHHQLSDKQIHVSEPIPVIPGWQIIEKDLSNLYWGLKRFDRPNQQDSKSSWGGAAGLVSRLRIDPVLNGSFAVDWLELGTGTGFPGYSEDIVTFKNLDDEVFQQMQEKTDRGWVLAQDNWLRIPESAHWQRLQIATKFPSAVVFPSVPGAEDLASSPGAETSPPWLVPAIIYAVAVALYLLRTVFVRKWRPACEIIILVLFFEAYVFWAPQLATTFRLMLSLPVLYVLWAMRPKSLRRELVGDVRAWILISPLLLIPLVAILSYLLTHGGIKVVFGTLGIYLVKALVQQYIVATMLLGRFQLINQSYAVILAACIFGFIHFPNFALMASTFLIGMIWFEIYKRHKNLLAITASHALLAVAFDLWAPAWLRLSGSVGSAFLSTL